MGTAARAKFRIKATQHMWLSTCSGEALPLDGSCLPLLCNGSSVIVAVAAGSGSVATTTPPPPADVSLSAEQDEDGGGPCGEQLAADEAPSSQGRTLLDKVEMDAVETILTANNPFALLASAG